MSQKSKKKEKAPPGGGPAVPSNSTEVSSAWWKRDWFFGLVVAVAILVTYQPVWHGLPLWDDDVHLTRPDLSSWGGLERIWFELGVTKQYYPLVHSVFWVENKLWGHAPLGYHLVNILLQGLSAFLLLKILRRLEVPGAWLAAAIFALHPVGVESVAWMSELKNMLSGVFYLGAALVYLKFDRTRKKDAYAVALLLFVLGLMSKSVIATLPAALLVIFWWKRGKLSWKQDVLPLVPFFIVGIASGLFTAWVERRFIGAEGSEFNFTMIERTLIAGRVVWFYLGKIFWPTNLIFIYPRWDVSETVGWQYLFPAAALILVLALGWMSWRWKWRGPLAGLLFFVGTLFPALGFLNVFPFRYSFVADHFQYLACLGIIVPCAAGLARLSDEALAGKAWLRSTLGAGLLLILGVMSWNRAWAYQSQETLWSDTVARNPTCWMAYNNLGNIFWAKGQLEEAIVQFQKALELNPSDDQARYNLGNILFEKSKIDEVTAHIQKALGTNPGVANGQNNPAK